MHFGGIFHCFELVLILESQSWIPQIPFNPYFKIGKVQSYNPLGSNGCQQWPFFP